MLPFTQKELENALAHTRMDFGFILQLTATLLNQSLARNFPKGLPITGSRPEIRDVVTGFKVGKDNHRRDVRLVATVETPDAVGVFNLLANDLSFAESSAVYLRGPLTPKAEPEGSEEKSSGARSSIGEAMRAASSPYRHGEIFEVAPIDKLLLCKDVLDMCCMIDALTLENLAEDAEAKQLIPNCIYYTDALHTASQSPVNVGTGVRLISQNPTFTLDSANNPVDCLVVYWAGDRTESAMIHSRRLFTHEELLKKNLNASLKNNSGFRRVEEPSEFFKDFMEQTKTGDLIFEITL